jgi:hypothetical protein
MTELAAALFVASDKVNEITYDLTCRIPVQAGAN